MFNVKNQQLKNSKDKNLRPQLNFKFHYKQLIKKQNEMKQWRKKEYVPERKGEEWVETLLENEEQEEDNAILILDCSEEREEVRVRRGLPKDEGIGCSRHRNTVISRLLLGGGQTKIKIKSTTITPLSFIILSIKKF